MGRGTCLRRRIRARAQSGVPTLSSWLSRCVSRVAVRCGRSESISPLKGATQPCWRWLWGLLLPNVCGYHLLTHPRGVFYDLSVMMACTELIRLALGCSLLYAGGSPLKVPDREGCQQGLPAPEWRVSDSRTDLRPQFSRFGHRLEKPRHSEGIGGAPRSADMQECRLARGLLASPVTEEAN
ncbi:MAG: hypothetical protein JWR26_3828 [Pedosphaera sp.]|nr:hypothetical protein [Pedosphaera sp.]